MGKPDTSEEQEDQASSETEEKTEEGATGKTNKRKVKGPTAKTKKIKEENPTAQAGEGPTGLPQRSWCLVHPQVPPLFCQDDRQCFCMVCDLSVHKSHTMLSEEEAEKRLRLLCNPEPV
uniref:B box-type domain-containing protein n=1 Tax=Knipowitschia caucasica TaxID=637954 RepID=A0AAV2KWF9_KNICA